MMPIGRIVLNLKDGTKEIAQGKFNPGNDTSLVITGDYSLTLSKDRTSGKLILTVPEREPNSMSDVMDDYVKEAVTKWMESITIKFERSGESVQPGSDAGSVDSA